MRTLFLFDPARLPSRLPAPTRMPFSLIAVSLSHVYSFSRLLFLTSSPSSSQSIQQYGFTKVRRGVDTDMYAHPGFCRDAPEGLLKLRKITSTSTTTSSVHGKNIVRRRAVSPTTTNTTAHLMGVECPPMITVHHATMTTATMVSHPSSPVANTATTTQVAAAPSVPPKTTTTTTTYQADSCGSSVNNSSSNNNDWGKLDLLAMAMEQEFAKQYHQQQQTSSSSLSLSRPW
jgi:hypothetical protein